MATHILITQVGFGNRLAEWQDIAKKQGAIQVAPDSFIVESSEKLVALTEMFETFWEPGDESYASFSLGGEFKSTSKRASETVNTAYSAVTQHWTQAGQVRWTLLYNFLMASTILLLAWATLFAPLSSAPSRKFVLVLLCVAGLALSIVWVGLGLRGCKFVDGYFKLGLRLEELIGDTGLFPFHSAQRTRDRIKRPVSMAQTETALVVVPLLFGIVYVILLLLSWRLKEPWL